MKKPVIGYSYFVDESGGISNDSRLFILGCLKTDTPKILEKRLVELAEKISDNIYFSGVSEGILLKGFHAVDDHPDIRAEVYKICHCSITGPILSS